MGVMPQPMGQVDRISTIEKAPPERWMSNARRSIPFALPIDDGSAIEPRAA